MTQSPLALFGLEGRLAVITGAGSGIGREAAMLFAAAGATVIVADVDEAGLAETAAAIGSAAHPILSDLGAPAAAERLADAAEAIGPIAIWANVAGVSATQPTLEATPEVYDRVTRINMDGAYWGCVAAARRMAPRGQGNIVNISSQAADQPMPDLSVYAMTKAALNMLTRSLALEHGPHGIRVNAVAPGFIATPMTMKPGLGDAVHEERAALFAQRSPLGIIGAPSDIAYAMLYLVSDASRFVTGQVLRVNGGASMP